MPEASGAWIVRLREIPCKRNTHSPTATKVLALFVRQYWGTGMYDLGLWVSLQGKEPRHATRRCTLRIWHGIFHCCRVAEFFSHLNTLCSLAGIFPPAPAGDRSVLFPPMGVPPPLKGSGLRAIERADEPMPTAKST